MMSLENNKTITNCNNCDNYTNHKILFTEKVEVENEDNEKEASLNKEFENYMVVRCEGCDETSFLIRHTGDKYIDEHNDFYDENFPEDENFESDFNFLDEEAFDELPKILANLYTQIESAFNEDANILAGVGLRMLVEALCLEQSIEGKNLQEKIKNLQSCGLISLNEVPILDKLRLIGNFSAHEIKGFSIDKLEYALDIINHVLKSVYLLPKINKKLKI